MKRPTYRRFYVRLFNRFCKERFDGQRLMVDIQLAWWNPLFWLWLVLPVPGSRRYLWNWRKRAR